jgi:ABC-type multidrug transport system permease subunit
METEPKLAPFLVEILFIKILFNPFLVIGGSIYLFVSGHIISGIIYLVVGWFVGVNIYHYERNKRIF